MPGTKAPPTAVWAVQGMAIAVSPSGTSSDSACPSRSTSQMGVLAAMAAEAVAPMRADGSWTAPSGTRSTSQVRVSTLRSEKASPRAMGFAATQISTVSPP